MMVTLCVLTHDLERGFSRLNFENNYLRNQFRSYFSADWQKMLSFVRRQKMLSFISYIRQWYHGRQSRGDVRLVDISAVGILIVLVIAFCLQINTM